MKAPPRSGAVTSDEILELAIQEALPDADRPTVRIITAVVGLIAAVAYADRSISPHETQHLRAELARIHGFLPSHVESVAQLVARHALQLNTAFVPKFTRTLRDCTDVETRLEVLSALLAMAAADGAISHDEVVNLRNLCTMLGLSQHHYNQLQAQYRDRLTSLL